MSKKFLQAEPYKVPEKEPSKDEQFAMQRELTARKAMSAMDLPELIEFYRQRAEQLKGMEQAGTVLPGGSDVESERILKMLLLNKLTGGAPVKATEAYEMAYPEK
jgi:hypothetical protein